ncbi:MAG: 6-oxocyclohex-1-ene-1-carbonyl-CoA hydratase, partial [Candidatus Bathyarchaeota archaeon]
VSCELWSSYKMKRLGLVSKVVPVIKENNAWVRNPTVILDKYVDDGEIVYGEFKTGSEYKEAQAAVKDAKTAGKIDFELLDKELDKIIWTFANLFPGCLIKAMDSIRAKKKFFWDLTKNYNRHWLAANMNYEAFLGFQAFNTRKLTGQGTIDFIKFRQLLAKGEAADAKTFEAVLPKPKKEADQ